MGEHEAPKAGPNYGALLRFIAYLTSAAILGALTASDFIPADTIKSLNIIFAGLFGVAAVNVPNFKGDK